jgi:arylsulfatase A-like enzyme
MRRFLLGLLLLPFAVSCGRAPEGRSVLLVTLDTTRADFLGAYGRPDARTPAFDRIARRGALFQDTIVDVPVTLPSHTSIMTGVPVLGHGVRYNADFKVAASAITLAETLAELGYDTAAVVSSLILDSAFGLDQGFERYDDDLPPGYVIFDRSKYPTTHWLPEAERRANDVVTPAIAWLQERRGRAPWFLWAHFYDAHFPYDPPPPWNRTSTSDYLAEIQFADRELGRLVRAVDARERGESAIVVVTADHGEGLDQHREENHGIFIYDDTIRVPLAVRASDALPAGRVVPELARSIDVAPTILEACGRTPSAIGVGGSLVPLAKAQGAPPDTAGYAESMKTKLFYSGSGLKSIRTKRAKFILAPRPELYDLEHDPGETRNLLDAAAPPSEGRAMRDELALRVRKILEHDLAAVEAANADEKTLEGIRSLGYVAGSDGSARPGSAQDELAMKGFDPKDLVDVSMGGREVQNGFYDRGERKLLRFFATATPASEDRAMARLWAAAHHNYARVWIARGDYLEAANEYARALESDPSYDEAAWSRIYALNLAREFASADRIARDTLAEHPEAWKVRLHRAFALALLGQGADAHAELQRIVEGAPPSHEARQAADIFLRSLGTPREPQALESYLASAALSTPAEDRAVD